MKQVSVIVLAFLCAFPLISCRMQEPDADSGVLRLSVSMYSSLGTETRTVVSDPDHPGDSGSGIGFQHAVYAHLYLFAEPREGGEAVCILESPLNWYEDGETPPKPDAGVPTRTKVVEVNLNPVRDRLDDYVGFTFLVIGLDSMPEDGRFSVDAYGMPGSLLGKTLSSVAAVLQPGKNYDGSVTVSEFFAGTETVPELDFNRVVHVVAYRRVAGFLAYLDRVPRNVDALVLRAAGDLNKAVSLVPRFDASVYADPVQVPDEAYEDYLYGPEYVLPEQTLMLRSDRLSGTGGSGTGVAPSELWKMNAYLLPVRFSPDRIGAGSTLMLELWDGDVRVASYKIVHRSSASRSGTGIIDGPDEYNPYYHYPIRANQLYRLGTKDNPVHLDGSVSEIEVWIDDVWDEYYGGSFGDPASGVGLDPEWGDHPGGGLVDPAG